MAGSSQLETVGCNLCGSASYSQLHVKHGYHIVRCNNCRLVFLNPRPVPSDLAGIYDTEAYYGGSAEFESVVVGYADYLALRDHLRFVVNELLRPIKPLTPGISLDVGCSMGLVMDEFRQRGWTPYGVDVSSYATRYARDELGLNAFTGTIDQVDLPPESVDLATMLLTIEHIPDPREALRSVRQLLKPGGVLIIATHDVDGIWPKLVGPRWRHYNMPEHIYYFSPPYAHPDAFRGRLPHLQGGGDPHPRSRHRGRRHRNGPLRPRPPPPQDQPPLGRRSRPPPPSRVGPWHQSG